MLFAAGVSTAPAQTVEESLAEGRAAFMSYDFKGAARHYATARKKAREIKSPPSWKSRKGN